MHGVKQQFAHVAASTLSCPASRLYFCKCNQSNRLSVAPATVHICESALDFECVIDAFAQGFTTDHAASSAYPNVLAVQCKNLTYHLANACFETFIVH